MKGVGGYLKQEDSKEANDCSRKTGDNQHNPCDADWLHRALSRFPVGEPVPRVKSKCNAYLRNRRTADSPPIVKEDTESATSVASDSTTARPIHFTGCDIPDRPTQNRQREDYSAYNRAEVVVLSFVKFEVEDDTPDGLGVNPAAPAAT